MTKKNVNTVCFLAPLETETWSYTCFFFFFFFFENCTMHNVFSVERKQPTDTNSCKWTQTHTKTKSNHLVPIPSHSQILKRNPPKKPQDWGGSRILVRGPVEFWPQGDWAQNLLKIGVFPLRIAWKLHDFEKNLGARGRPPVTPGSAVAGRFHCLLCQTFSRLDMDSESFSFAWTQIGSFYLLFLSFFLFWCF